MTTLQISLGAAKSDADFATARALLGEYRAWVGGARCFGGFAQELADLRGAYAPPRGLLVLAKVDELVVGCGGFMVTGNDRCELKRLYMHPQARGTGGGRALAVALMDHARAGGCKVMTLESLAKMETALTLYRDLGFHETGREGETGPDQVVFMEIDLCAAKVLAVRAEMGGAG